VRISTLKVNLKTRLAVWNGLIDWLILLQNTGETNDPTRNQVPA
jgi:hypothetical protein